MRLRIYPDGSGVLLFDGRYCRLCKDGKVYRMGGRTAHGMAHERRGEVGLELEPSVQGHRYVFVIPREKRNG